MQRIGDSLNGKKVLVTQCDDFMGPALVTAFQHYGASVYPDPRPLTSTQIIDDMLQQCGPPDVLIVNLAIKNPRTPYNDVDDRQWQTVFDHLVTPLPALFGRVLPRMIARKTGKIVVMGSASALRGMRNASTYSAARGAQVSYVRAIGTEVAEHNVQINLIAQNFVENETYFPAEVKATEAFQTRINNEVPIKRLATAEEDAQFAVFLASSEVNFFVGQSFPFAGGWTT